MSDVALLGHRIWMNRNGNISFICNLSCARGRGIIKSQWIAMTCHMTCYFRGCMSQAQFIFTTDCNDIIIPEGVCIHVYSLGWPHPVPQACGKGCGHARLTCISLSLVPRLSWNANIYCAESLVSFVRKHDVSKIGPN